VNTGEIMERSNVGETQELHVDADGAGTPRTRPSYRDSHEGLEGAGWTRREARRILARGFRVGRLPGSANWIDRLAAAEIAILGIVEGLPGPVVRELLRRLAADLGAIRRARQLPTDPPEACP
jgi:hypothetical protein